jgi:hypothetical protein
MIRSNDSAIINCCCRHDVDVNISIAATIAGTMADAPTAGRRAGRRAGNVGEGADGGGASVGWGTEATESNPAQNADGPPSPDGPQHGRRKGGAASGWGEPAADEGPGAEAPAPAPMPPPRRDSDDDDGVASFIPDLEEEEEEEQIRQVSEAPAVQHQMQSIDELDNGADAAGALHMVDHGIDLSLLTGCLSARGHVEEADTGWDFNGLLSEISQELQKEEDKKDVEEEEES